jgi:ketosteroid isomerase-like protein
MPAREKNAIFFPKGANQPARDLVFEVLRTRADPSACIVHFHEDAVFTMIGRMCDYSFSGVFRGRAQILDLFRRVDAEIEMSEHKILNLVIEGDSVALRRSVVVRHYGTAAMTGLIIGNFVRFREGKIAEIHEYSDTAWLRRLSGD